MAGLVQAGYLTSSLLCIGNIFIYDVDDTSTLTDYYNRLSFWTCIASNRTSR